jgi:hypothetical protein
MSTDDQFEPYVLCRVAGHRLECALWTMPDGKPALALFLTSATALAYRDAMRLDEQWKVVRPARRDLVQILKSSHASGVANAVLDPDLESARYVFVLKHVLQQLGELN